MVKIFKNCSDRPFKAIMVLSEPLKWDNLKYVDTIA